MAVTGYVRPKDKSFWWRTSSALVIYCVAHCSSSCLHTGSFDTHSAQPAEASCGLNCRLHGNATLGIRQHIPQAASEMLARHQDLQRKDWSPGELTDQKLAQMQCIINRKCWACCKSARCGRNLQIGASACSFVMTMMASGRAVPACGCFMMLWCPG